MIIGIDIGVYNGVAIFENSKLTSLFTLNTYKLIEFLQDNKNKITMIIIEDSTIQSHIWNSSNQSRAVFGKHARNIGSVDGKVMTIKETCKELKLICISPFKKGKKWNSEEFKKYFTYYNKRTNQHE